MSCRTSLQFSSFSLSRPWFWLLLGALYFLTPEFEAPPSAGSADITALLAASAQVPPIVQVLPATFPMSLIAGHVFLPVFPAPLRAVRPGESTGAVARQGAAVLPRPPPAG